MSQADVTVGIPAIVNCLIMVPFSIFFHYAYDVGPYIIGGRRRHAEGGHFTQHSYPQHYQGGFLGIRAFAGMVNPHELLGAIGFVFKMGPPNKSGGGGGGSAAVNGHYGGGRGHDGEYAHEMGRREQRRMDKHAACADSGAYYTNGNGNANGSYRYNGQQQQQQNGGYQQNGRYQQGYR